MFIDIWKAKDQVVRFLMGKTPNICIFLALNLMYVCDSGTSYIYGGCKLVTFVYIIKCDFRGSIGASRKWQEKGIKGVCIEIGKGHQSLMYWVWKFML